MIVHGGSYMTEGALRELGMKRVGENVRVHALTSIVGLENIEIGDNVRVDPYVNLVAGEHGYLRIGSYVHIGSFCYLSGARGIEMKDFSGLSQGVKIYSASDDYSGASLTNPTVPEKYLGLREGPVTLGRHVIVGSGSVIMPGLEIGDGAAVGALSFVTKSLEGWGMYFGCPAKRIAARKKNLLELEKALLVEQAASRGGAQ